MITSGKTRKAIKMRSFVAQFAENLWAVIPSYTSFASFGSIRDVSVLEVD